MTVHDQFAEDLALYALGALDGTDALEKHLVECASCRRELEQLRGDAALLALTTAGPKPPARAKSRLMEVIGKEPRVQLAKAPSRSWTLGWIGAVAMIAVAAVLWNQNSNLKSQVQESARISEHQKAQLEEARKIVDTLMAKDAMHVSVVPVGMKTPPPEGKVIYSRDRSGLILMAGNLQPLPAQKAYELWLIPTQGAPIPAGVFKPDAHGSALVVNPPLPTGVEAKAFAITIEPEQGSTTPTMPIVMMGSGG